jgi:hypothetical protein
MIRAFACGLLACTVLACTAPCLEGPVAINLTIDDSLTATPVDSAVVELTDPAGLMHTYPAGPGAAYPLMIGQEPGKYAISITSPGYINWTRSVDVASTHGGCNSVPVTLTALLQR